MLYFATKPLQLCDISERNLQLKNFKSQKFVVQQLKQMQLTLYWLDSEFQSTPSSIQFILSNPIGNTYQTIIISNLKLTVLLTM